MKIIKKLGVRALLFLVPLLGFMFLAGDGKVSAATPNFHLKFSDSRGSSIVGSYNGQSIKFRDMATGSSTSRTYETISGDVILDCSVAKIVVSESAASRGLAVTALVNSFKYKPSSSASCTDYGSSTIPVGAYNSSSTTPTPKAQIDWAGSKGRLNDNGSELVVTFKDGKKITFKDSNPGDKTINFKPVLGSAGITLTGATLASWCSNTLYAPSGGDKAYGITLGSYTDKTGTVKICYNNGSPNTITQDASVTVDSSAYTKAQAAGSSVGGGGGNSEDCEVQAASQTKLTGRALAFVACPMLDAAQSLADTLTGIVENQLTFTFQHNLGDAAQKNNVRGAWTQMRDLASILLVIIMLVMVLSQAISWGPFDAYTVKKVLPKLVVAVIAMQLSWSLLDYVVGIFDDLGHGVADLLYGPFGGANAVSLKSILDSANIPASATGTVGFVGLLGVGAIAVLSLPTILLVGWSIVLAIATAFVTLAVRQILIIASVILAPIAILLWIMPGTQRYWKMWYDNFTKLMLMFPLIIALIATGRIFALITSSGTNDRLIKFILIVIGYYGPFFFIPKAYKWGGQAMSMAGGAISENIPKLGGPGTNYLKGVQERSRWNLSRQRRKAQLMRRAQEQWSRGMTRGRFDPRGYVNRARGAGLRSAGLPGRIGDRLTPWVRGDRQIRERIMYGAEAEGDKALKEQAQEVFAHLMRQTIQDGNWARIMDMATNGEQHEREEAITQMIRMRRSAELLHLQTTSPTYGEDARGALAKDESGRLFDAYIGMGMTPP